MMTSLPIDPAQRRNAELDPIASTKNNPLMHASHLTQAQTQGNIQLSGLTRMSEAISSLKKMPDVRDEKVQVAQKLIQDPNYPTDQDLEKVASALLDENAF